MHTQGPEIRKFRIKNEVEDKAGTDTDQPASKGWDQDKRRLEGYGLQNSATKGLKSQIQSQGKSA